VTSEAAAPWELRALYNGMPIASRFFVSVAGAPASGEIIDFTTNGSFTGKAGLPFVPSAGFRGYCLKVRDRYNQTIADPSLNGAFTMVMKPSSGNYSVPVGSVLATASDGTQCYQLSFTPTRVNSQSTTPFEILYNGSLLVNYTRGIFFPGDVDVSKVDVDNLQQVYKADEHFQFSVTLVDTYGNVISSSTDPLSGQIATLPTRGRIVGPLGVLFQSPRWIFTYPGTAASPGDLTYAGNWSIALTYKGAVLGLGPSNDFYVDLG
jgi:hypothetical protein